MCLEPQPVSVLQRFATAPVLTKKHIILYFILFTATTGWLLSKTNNLVLYLLTINCALVNCSHLNTTNKLNNLDSQKRAFLSVLLGGHSVVRAVLLFGAQHRCKSMQETTNQQLVVRSICPLRQRSSPPSILSIWYERDVHCV